MNIFLNKKKSIKNYFYFVIFKLFIKKITNKNNNNNNINENIHEHIKIR
jgi:hypothetical protein